MSCKTQSSITLKRADPSPARASATASRSNSGEIGNNRPKQQTSSVYMPFTPPTTPKTQHKAHPQPQKVYRPPPKNSKEAKEKLEDVLKKQLIFTAFSPAELRRDRLGKPVVLDPETNRANDVVLKPRRVVEDKPTSRASISLSKSVPNSPQLMKRRETSLSRAPPGRPAHYGTPVEGSKTEERAILAHKRVCKEVMQLCDVIDEHGTEDPKDFKVKITFGRLFELYTFISDKVVGILLRARKHGLVHFEGETLFQGQDNAKIISLLMPIHAIRKKLAAEEEREFSWGKCM